MPLPRRAYGRPGTQVIPDDWNSSHAPVAAKTMRATVSLRKPGGTTAFDDTVHKDVTVPLEPYAADVPARIQAQTSTAIRADIDAAEDTVHVAGYLITIPLGTTADVATEDLIDVTGVSDPLLVGRSFRVVDVLRGTERFERDLFCTLND